LAGFPKNGRISDLPEPKSGTTVHKSRYFYSSVWTFIDLMMMGNVTFYEVCCLRCVRATHFTTRRRQHSRVLTFIRPLVRSNGRSYKMLVMFFLTRHRCSELPRPIAVKLCHMIGNWLNFIMQVQKFGERSPIQIWGQKHAKFRSILYNLRI